MTRLYLAGPVTGKPNYNREAFSQAADKLRNRGYESFWPNPEGIDKLNDYQESIEYERYGL